MQGVNSLDGAILMIAIVIARTPIARPVVMPKIGKRKTCDRDQTAIRHQETVIFAKNVAMKLCVWLVIIADRCDLRLQFREAQDCWRALRHSQNSMEKYTKNVSQPWYHKIAARFPRSMFYSKRHKIEKYCSDCLDWSKHQKVTSEVHFWLFLGPKKKQLGLLKIAKPPRFFALPKRCKNDRPFPRLNDPTLPPKMTRNWLT